MKLYIVAIALMVWQEPAMAQPYTYPVTRTVDSTDSYFGRTYKDPYRWLENLGDNHVIEWFKSQNRLADSLLTNISGAGPFIEELSTYLNAGTWGRQPMFAIRKGYVYTKAQRGQLDAPVYFRHRNDTTEQLLFNTWQVNPGMRYQLQAINASPDEKYLLAAFDKNGEEYPFIKVYDLTANRWLPDSIPHCWPNTINWAADSKGFIYGYNTAKDRTIPDATNYDVVRYHRLHSAFTADITVMNNTLRNRAEKKISNSYYAYLFIDESSRRIYFMPNQGFEADYASQYYCPAAELLRPDKRWQRLYHRTDSVLSVKETEAGYYFISGKGKGFKSLRYTSFRQPDFTHAKIILPEDSVWQLENIDETRSFILARYSKYGFTDKTVFINKATGRPVSLTALRQYDRYSTYSLGKKSDTCIVYQRAVNRPGYGYRLDITADQLIDDPFWAPHGQTILPGSEDIITELIEVPSHDGTRVPMTIMRDKNTPLNGKNSCILYGYGAYGISTKDNSFNEYNPINSLLIRQGVILAHAYVRGGGEKGESWHRAGMKENKPNSWKDFIACAGYLISNHYTQPQTLACYGGSAGGILIGRSIEARPDLFAAAFIQSGSVNQIRGKAWANQISNYGEYGNPAIESEMKGLIEMDAVIHVESGVNYPAVYLTTGINDTRVAPWAPGKLAASLQAGSTSGKPVLLSTEFEGGHFGYANAANVTDLLRIQLRSLFFLLWQTGHPAFSMK
nr:prolyl oligopeptidase family serine peptidase [uncultured Arsenicibacter sp.]